MGATIPAVGHGAHNVCVAMALVVGAIVFLREARRRAVDEERLYPVLAGVLVGGAIGARLAGVLQGVTRAQSEPLYLLWVYGGRSILGGLSGAYVGALLAKRLVGYRERTGDLFAPAVALALAVGRIGCFLTEAPGRPTSLLWGVRVSPEAAASMPECPACLAGERMHPSFLYEIGFLLIAYAVITLWARGRVNAAGELLPLFLAGYAAFRFLVEFTRANDVALAGLTRSQWFLLAVSPLLIAHLVRQARAGTYTNLVPAARRRTTGRAG